MCLYFQTEEAEDPSKLLSKEEKIKRAQDITQMRILTQNEFSKIHARQIQKEVTGRVRILLLRICVKSLHVLKCKNSYVLTVTHYMIETFINFLQF